MILGTLLINGLVSLVGAFSLITHPMRARIYQGRGIPLPTKSLLYNSISGEDFVDVAGTEIPALTCYPGAKRALKRLFVVLPTITNGRHLFVGDNYVSRPSIEDKILQVYNSPLRSGRDSYTVVVGPTGSGKDFVTMRVLGQKPGVLWVSVSEALTPSSLLRRLLQTSGVAVEQNMLLGLNVLLPVFQQIADHNDGRPITIVFDVSVEEGPSLENVLYSVKSAAKKLAPAANVIVLLSGTTAGITFDDYRMEKIIWVDEMTHEEAAAYAKKLFPAVADTDVELLFDKVGDLSCDFCHANHPFTPIRVF